ncbi:MAG: protein translocase subunit SecF [Actinobacteria bacterium]|nr:protein translocase subunit SecF [Actinomycetota bacterium]
MPAGSIRTGNDPRTIEAGMLLIGAGAILLFVSLFLEWYDPRLDAWEIFEVWDLVLALLAIVALVAAASRLGIGPPRPPSWLIGPTLGTELRNKAIIALVIALVAQLAYLAIRFRWTFAAGTVLAMFHDVLIVIGIFAWLGKPIDGVFLAAALTIIGVSVNDSVVTMDRIRETWSENRTRKLPGVVNQAIIATAPRTINTGLGAFFILGALTFLGGRSLTDFALALLIGLFVGTYSSAFVASPLMMLLEKKNNAPPPLPKRKTSSASSRPRPRPKPAPRPARVAREGGTV